MFWGIAQVSREGSVSCDSAMFTSSPTACKPPRPSVSSLKHVNPMEFVMSSSVLGFWSLKAIAECQELVALQNADGSWALSSGLASVLEIDEAEIKAKMPGEVRGKPLMVAACHPGAVGTPWLVATLASQGQTERNEGIRNQKPQRKGWEAMRGQGGCSALSAGLSHCSPAGHGAKHLGHSPGCDLAAQK